MIEFPLENLDMSSYVKGYNSKSYVYDLYGICNHLGGPMGGHYTSYVRNANNKWYKFNDTNVSEIENPATMIKSDAYCFFYRKR